MKNKPVAPNKLFCNSSHYGGPIGNNILYIKPRQAAFFQSSDYCVENGFGIMSNSVEVGNVQSDFITTKILGPSVGLYAEVMILISAHFYIW